MILNIKNYHQGNILLATVTKTILFSFVTFLLLIANPPKLWAQKAIAVKVKNTSLSSLFTSLRDEYDIKISFNDDKLSQYQISLDKKFNSVEEALTFLIKDFPLSLEKSNDVFIIINKKESVYAKRNILTANIIDGTTGESLPYSSVVVNNYPLQTDLKGNFSYTSNTDSSFNLKVSYLGYYKLDTSVYASTNYTLKLYKQNIVIDEVVLVSRDFGIAGKTNFSSGNLKLNNTAGQYLPGSSDNAIYNLLRLQPGILAAGEQANDLIIWGSYRGQTKVSFDGFTIFGVRNFNDNIGAVNPLMAKDLAIKKGGYGAEQGDRVGGIVDITGIEGNNNTPTLNVSANNLTLNAAVSTPLFHNTSLVLAGRQTYYNLYDPYKVAAGNRNNNQNIVDLTIRPDYVFKDINLKFSGKSNKGENYFLSLFSGADNLTSAYNTQQGRLQVNGNDFEKNSQYGAAAFYSKLSKKGSISSISIASSELNTNSEKKNIVTQQVNGQKFNTRINSISNDIEEQSVKVTYKLPSTQKFNLFSGAGFIKNATAFTQDSSQIRKVNDLNYSNRIYTFVESPYFFASNFFLTPGIRADYDLDILKFYVQPRLSVTYLFNDKFKTTASWGLYNQFIAYNVITDARGNYQYQWTVSNGKSTPVYKSQHLVLGTAFENNKLWLNADIYYRTTTGITRFFENQRRTILIGDGYSKGIDLLAKKEYKGNLMWISYSLTDTKERFPVRIRNQIINSYNRAPQDQTHEIKVAGILNLSPFYFSANYVYGSGFPSTDPLDDPSVNQIAYNRFDTALTYKFSAKKYRLETGISILNVFNTQNIKTGNLQRIPLEQLNTVNIYSQAVPFTPTLFLSFVL